MGKKIKKSPSHRESSPNITARILWFLARTAGTILGIDSSGIERIPAKGPLLIIAPHASYLDPVFLLSVLPRLPVFIADSYFFFLHPALSFLMRTFDVIPANKTKPGPIPLRRLLRNLEQGRACVIFPEGARTFDAKPLMPSASASRFIMKLKIPVAVISIKGAYNTWPRWDPKPRLRTKSVTIGLSHWLRSPDTAGPDIKNAKHPWQNVYDLKKNITIHGSRNTVLNALNEAAKGEDTNIVLTYGDRARYISNFLFLCPLCLRANTLGFDTDSSSLKCDICKLNLQIQGSHLTMTTGDDSVTRHISAWFEDMLYSICKKSAGELFHETDVLYDCAQDKKGLRQTRLRINENGILVFTKEKHEVRIPAAKAARASLKGISVIELLYNGKVYTIKSRSGTAAAWLTILRVIAGSKKSFSDEIPRHAILAEN
ncbi:lysophospholipid acyltransferase family protein [Elusimicrobiota bacterium]